MATKEDFFNHITTGYTTKGDFITMGSAMFNGETLTDAFVKIPLKTLNRHGLIAGATGTGKSKTLQVLSENLSEKGVPVLLMDIKGDLSGVAQPGEEKPFITERHQKIGLPYQTKTFPVELLSLSEEKGARLRATVSEFGPVLLSRILDLSDVQSGILSVLFKYCDDHHLPLLDLNDLKKILQYSTNEGKEEIENEYGRISSASTGAILRKIVELEHQGGDLFFGERSFDPQDFLRTDDRGMGFINVLRLTDIQDRPKLFSTFMLCLLAEIYATFPEQGDSDKPKLVIFIEEAHLIFSNASKALLDQIEAIVKLIRSKGVGIFFVTQNPTDVPQEVLSQLGLKVQHALRAFTAKDRKAIKLSAENYPISEYYKTDEILTSLGIGEALISALNEKGIPTPLAATMLRAPMSRMDILQTNEINTLIDQSKLVKKYNEAIDRESAYELLNEKIAFAEKQDAIEKARHEREAASKASSRSKTTSSRRTTQNPITKLLSSPTVIRSILGILGKMIK
ncbi:helicase HerA-like domain-containing protein [uncultured Planktosalinus sp.]|uniref:helicase HerA-like domain-containing protein n=1 Tax=uncultured Planktosalinus sp. TaxID=1810935 RepID=UPI0030D74B89